MELIDKKQVIDILKRDMKDFEEVLEFFEKKKQYKECVSVEAKLTLLESLILVIENLSPIKYTDDEHTIPIENFIAATFPSIRKNIIEEP
jgi:hypothetical protein